VGHADLDGRRVALAVALAVLVLLVGPVASAHAHTALSGSAPADGERLAYPPDELLLTFAEPVSLATLSVSLRAADGTPVPVTARPSGGIAPDGRDDGDQRTAPEARRTAAVFDIPPVPDGVYGISWQSVGDDGHRAGGEILFGVGAEPGGTTLAPPRSAERPGTSRSPRQLRWRSSAGHVARTSPGLPATGPAGCWS
jgi:methionine-rich copper-binding protein CopC